MEIILIKESRMFRTTKYIPVLVLLVLLTGACSGGTAEAVQESSWVEVASFSLSSLENESDPAPGIVGVSAVSHENDPTDDSSSTPPDQPETLAAAPEPVADTRSPLEPPAIGGILAADLAPLQIFSTATGGDEGAAVTAVAFSPDSSLIAAALADGTIRVWGATSGDLLFSLVGHTAQVADLAFSPDGALLATAGEDSLVFVWDTTSGTRLNTLSTSLIGRALAVTFSPDGNQITVGGQRCAVALYNTWTGLLNRTFPQPGCDLQDSGAVQHWGLASTAGGARLITAEGQTGEGGSVQVWEMGTYTSAEQVAYFYLGVRDLVLSPDGETLAASLIGSSQVTLVDLESGEELYTLEGHLHRVNGVAFSPDGRLVASASRDGAVHLWDVSNGYLLKTLEDHTEAVNAVTFSPDGTLVASGSDDGTVILWGLDVEGN